MDHQTALDSARLVRGPRSCWPLRCTCQWLRPLACWSLSQLRMSPPKKSFGAALKNMVGKRRTKTVVPTYWVLTFWAKPIMIIMIQLLKWLLFTDFAERWQVFQSIDPIGVQSQLQRCCQVAAYCRLLPLRHPGGLADIHYFGAVLVNHPRDSDSLLSIDDGEPGWVVRRLQSGQMEEEKAKFVWTCLFKTNQTFCKLLVVL